MYQYTKVLKCIYCSWCVKRTQYTKVFKCIYCSGFVKCISIRRVVNVYTVVGLLNVSVYEGF